MRAHSVYWNFIEPPGFSISRPNGLREYLIVLMRSPAYFIFDGVRTEASAGKFILFRKNTPQFFGYSKDAFINDAVHFDADDEDVRWIENLGIPFDTLVDVANIGMLSNIIKDIDREVRFGDEHSDELGGLYIKIFFLKLAGELAKNKGESALPYYEYYDAAVSLRAQIYNLPSKEWSISEMASELSLSVSYFQHLYKHFFGVSAISDVINSRIERAKHLLDNTSSSVGEISRLCGYKSDVHFMRQFKKIVGASPSEYRLRSM